MAGFIISMLIPLLFVGLWPDGIWVFVALEIVIGAIGAAYFIYQAKDKRRAARVNYEFNRPFHEDAEDDEEDDISFFTPSGDPEMFERQIAEMFRRYGYEVRVTPYVGDGGVDLRVFKDGEFGIVQVKRHKNPIGEPAIRDFFGCLKHENADIGYFITTSRFTDNVYRWVKGKRIMLIDGNALQEMFNETQLWEGVMS